jgi:subtilisin family serine protease
MGTYDTPPGVITPPVRPGRGAVVYAVFLGGWIVIVTAGIQAITWALEQVALVEGVSLGPIGWPLAGWINAVLVGVPAIPIATLAKRPNTRAAGVSWSLAALMLGVVGSVRAIPAQQNEIYLLVLAAVTTIVGVVLRLVLPAARPYPKAVDGPLPYAVAAGLGVLVPWFWVGALGGPLETGLAILAAVGCGFLASVVLSPILCRVADLSPAAPARVTVTAGLASSVALVPLAATFGGSGPHLAQMLMLPMLGFVATAFARRGARLLAPALLIGAAALGPLAFVEADETSVVLGFHDVGYWALIGALCSLAIATVVAVIALVVTRRTRERPTPRLVGPILVTAAVVAAAVVYPVAGHPGFFGDELFVVMKTQANLSGAASIADPVRRRVAVYAELIRVADATQAPLRAELRRQHLSYTPYYLLNGILVRDGPEARIWLSRRSDVDRVLLNPTLRPIPAAEPPMRGHAMTLEDPQWNIAQINAPEVWATGDTGQGIVIGGSDTGVDLAHPALTRSYRGGDDSWYDPWNGTSAPVDVEGHGTHTMGSALGAGGIGVAPGAQWMACVNLGRDMANPGYYLDCMQFMLAPFARGGDAFHGDPSRGADIQTNSWGCPTTEGCDLRSLEPAVDALTSAGVFFVAAAGNEGPRCGSIDDAPAPYAATFTVGAVDRDGTVADFSSRSTGTATSPAKPDVVAPGVGVVSALPGGGYAALDGTSMATPQVAGVVALMWSANPALRGDVALTAKILRDTASPATATHDDGCGGAAQTGAGEVNAQAAVAAARSTGS